MRCHLDRSERSHRSRKGSFPLPMKCHLDRSERSHRSRSGETCSSARIACTPSGKPHPRPQLEPQSSQLTAHSSKAKPSLPLLLSLLLPLPVVILTLSEVEGRRTAFALAVAFLVVILSVARNLLLAPGATAPLFSHNQRPSASAFEFPRAIAYHGESRRIRPAARRERTGLWRG